MAEQVLGPTSIFLYPTTYPENDPSSVEVRLNQELVKAYALQPNAANVAPLETIHLTVNSQRGAPDIPEETARKLNSMMAALAPLRNLTPPLVRPNPSWPGGLSPGATVQVNEFLLRAAGVLAPPRQPLVPADPVIQLPQSGYLDYGVADYSSLLTVFMLDDI